MEKKFSLELERLIGSTKVTLRKDVIETEDIRETVRMLNGELDKVTSANVITNSASIQPSINVPIGLRPAPQFEGSISEMPTLNNPPHSYNPAAAIDEILDPQQSTWAQQPRSVKEIQERLIELGVRGVSNKQIFDRTVRGMQGSGKLKREKKDGIWKYYKMPSGV